MIRSIVSHLSYWCRWDLFLFLLVVLFPPSARVSAVKTHDVAQSTLLWQHVNVFSHGSSDGEKKTILFQAAKEFLEDIIIQDISSISSYYLTHWGRVTYICVSKLTIIGSDNGLSPGWRQAIIWTNACILLIGPLGTNFSEILVEILTFSFMKMRLKVLSAKWWPFCLGLNVLTHWPLGDVVTHVVL